MNSLKLWKINEFWLNLWNISLVLSGSVCWKLGTAGLINYWFRRVQKFFSLHCVSRSLLHFFLFLFVIRLQTRFFDVFFYEIKNNRKSGCRSFLTFAHDNRKNQPNPQKIHKKKKYEWEFVSNLFALACARYTNLWSRILNFFAQQHQ